MALLVASAGVWLVADRELDALTGLRLARLPDHPADGNRPVLERRVPDLVLPGPAQVDLPWRRVRVRFSGFLAVPHAGRRQLRLVASGGARLLLDGQAIAVRRASQVAPASEAGVHLAAGIHALEVSYESAQGPHVLRVLEVDARRGRRLVRTALFPDPPTANVLGRVSRDVWLRRGAAWLIVVGAATLLASRLQSRQAALAAARRLAGIGWRSAPLLVVLFGAALRAEALVDRSWQEQAPRWLRRLAVAMKGLHPAGLSVAPGDGSYEGDPFTYLRFAREMQHFYDAHVREPFFVASARAGLELVDDASVGLSLTSACYSGLLVLATYLLGATLFSRGVGLAAALALAVERHTIQLGVEGWRDDAFAFLSVLALLALQRLSDRPVFARAVLAGLAMGAVVLTRITALSFVVPIMLWTLGVAVRRDGRRAREALATALGIAAAVVTPYLISCWIAFGDPFYAIDAHTVFYRAGAGLPHTEPMNVVRFLGYGRGPYELLDTTLEGLTSYPFLNKWSDFDDWLPGASVGLPGAALAGLITLPFLPRGRPLLIAVLAAMVPYATTWRLPGGAEWRFTLHLYPLYLIAAAWALAALTRPADRRRLLRAAALAALAAPLLWIGVSGLHYLRLGEELEAGKTVTVRSGWRDAFVLRRGWSWPFPFGKDSGRDNQGTSGSIRLPLRAGRSYDIRLRLRAASACAGDCRALLAFNGRALAGLELAAVPIEEASGTYPLRLAGSEVRDGDNLLSIAGGPVIFESARLEAVDTDAVPR